MVIVTLVALEGSMATLYVVPADSVTGLSKYKFSMLLPTKLVSPSKAVELLDNSNDWSDEDGFQGVDGGEY